MSSTLYSLEGIDAHIRDRIDDDLQNSFARRNTFVYFMGLRTSEQKGTLGQSARGDTGRPSTSAALGDMNISQAMLENEIMDKRRHHEHVISLPSDNAAVELGGATPTAANLAENNVFTTSYSYTHHQAPIKISKDVIEMDKSEWAVGSTVDKAMNPVWESFMQYINALILFGGTGSNGSAVNMNSAAQQNKVIWSENLGVIYTLTQGNIYGNVDRSSKTQINPGLINATTDFASTHIDLEMIGQINRGFTKQTGTDFVGMSQINPNNVGCTLFMVHPTLYNELRVQAEARGIVQITGGVQGHAITGFKYPYLVHDGCFITCDRLVPTGYMLCLDLERWLMEVPQGHNFEWTGLVDEAKTVRGGDNILWGNIDFSFRMSCMRPDLQVLVTGLTAA